MILNLTQHPATVEQLKAGVIDLGEKEKMTLQCLLTFDELPTQQEIAKRAKAISALAMREHVSNVMVGGAPYLMAPLETTLRAIGISPMYSFSQRVSEEQTQPDGTVVKVNSFKHLGWVIP